MNSPRALAPLIQRRDALSETHANISQQHSRTMTTLASIELATLDARLHNQVLAAKVLALANQRDAERAKQHTPEITNAERRLAEAKAVWEVTRNVTRAVIVASGVDWVRDRELRELVLACGDDVVE